MLQPEPRTTKQIQEVFQQENHIICKTEGGMLRIRPYGNKIVRVTYTEEAAFAEETKLGFLGKDIPSEWEYYEEENNIEIKLAEVRLIINKLTLSIQYYSNNGKLLLSEKEEDSKILDGFDSYKTVLDSDSKIDEVVTPDGVKKVIAESRKIFDKRLYHTTLHLKFQEEERIYGLGQNDEGTLNYRGTTQYIHQANMKIGIPFFLSSKGYGILSATSGVSIFNDNEYGSYLYTDADVELDYYFIYGPSFDEIIRGYRALTGKASVLPKWAFGFIQSQERYETQEEILEVAREYRDRGLALDCIVLDWLSWGDGKWGEKIFDETRFPDVEGMVTSLEEMGTHFMMSIWPNMNEETQNYKEFAEKGLLLPGCGIYDAFNEQARDLYWDQVKRGLYGRGVKAFWCDSSEPITPEWNKMIKPIPQEMYHQYIEEVSKFIPRDKINAYGLVHSQSIYEGQSNEPDNNLVCNLTRSTYTGGQKYGTILWSGDISASWDTLRKQVVAAMNFCATGLPYWTLDIGGFFVKKGKPWFWNGEYENTSDDENYKELFTRWFQFAAFLPVFRSHGTDVRRELWNFGEEGTIYYDAMKSALELRYSLMPYIYSMVEKVREEDSTMLRMLAFDYREDNEALDITDQFMFGESIMVCPILNKGQTKRSVYLPKGNPWYNFTTGEEYSDGQWIEVPVTMQEIPLFTRVRT